jgi:ribosomal protein S18 acetylase RimI-like enzyme
VSRAEPAVGLRPATESDRPFLARVFASTRVGELAPLPWTDDQKRGFLEQQFAAQSADYARNYPDASFDVVVVDGEPAGRLIVARWESELHIVDIALVPEHRGRGVGTRLLRPLLDEAERDRVPVTIYVEHANRALTLYRRLGFAPVDDTGVYFKMERPPGARQAKIAS